MDIECKDDLHIVNKLVANLRTLMHSKKMNEAELARKTNIPQPTLHKILTKKTTDPRASTLGSLANYFGITIDELLCGNSVAQNNPFLRIQPTAIISWSQCINGASLIKTLDTSNWNNWLITETPSKNTFGLLSKPSMEPRFARGTILIINTDLLVKDGDIVLAHFHNTQEATLREISIDGPIKLLLPINNNAEQITLNNEIKIIGVLVKSIFAYQ